MEIESTTIDASSNAAPIASRWLRRAICTAAGHDAAATTGHALWRNSAGSTLWWDASAERTEVATTREEMRREND